MLMIHQQEFFQTMERVDLRSHENTDTSFLGFTDFSQKSRNSARIKLMEYQKDYKAFGATLLGSDEKYNESQYLVDSSLGLYIVCDGKADNGQGAAAGKMVMSFLQDVIFSKKELLSGVGQNPAKNDLEQLVNLLIEGVRKTSHQVHKENLMQKDHGHVGSSLALALVVGNNAILVHLGSSSIYLQREGELHPLTKKSQELLGTGQDLSIETISLELNRGDNLLLCTEGLGETLSKDQVGFVLQQGHCEDYVDDLLKAVQKKLNHPTVTAIAISFHKVRSVKEKTSPHKKVQILKKMPLFSLLEFKEIAKVLSGMSHQSYKKDEAVVIEGAQGEELFVILRGSADVIVGSKVINTLEDSDYFGELSLIDKNPRSATVRANGDLEVLVMHKDDFYKIISKEKNISIKLLWMLTKTLSARLRKTDSLLSDVGEGIKTLVDVEELKLDLE